MERLYSTKQAGRTAARADYSKILAELREKKGWTQTELAEKLGITHAMVSRIEKGTRAPAVKLRKQINDLVEELGLGIDVPPVEWHDTLTSEEKVLVVAYRTLSEENKSAFADLLLAKDWRV